MKMHLVLLTPRDFNPHMTRCGKNVLLGNIQYTVKRDNEPDRYKGVTCHWCRWGRGDKEIGSKGL